MNQATLDTLSGSAKLKALFDQGFAAAPEPRAAAEPVILIRAGGESWAVRTSHLAALVKSRKIVPLPSRMPELLGVAALRGVLIPVFSLAAVLGFSAGAGRPPWMMVLAGDTAIGLAFDAFEGQQPAGWVSEPPSARPHVLQVVGTASGARALLDLPGLAALVRQRAALPDKEK